MRREFGMLVALIALCAVIWYSNPDFAGNSNVFNTTRQFAMLGILAIGSAFVIVTGGIDLSVGSLVGLTGVVLAKVSSHSSGGMGHPLWVGILVAMGVALLIGLIQGLLITRMDLQPFIVTLGFMLMLRGISQTMVHGGNVSFDSFKYFANFPVLTVGDDPVLPLLLLILVIAAVAAAYLLHFTVFGRYVFAIGGNRDAAQYSGIPVKNVEMLTYVISAGMAGLAGICWCSYISQMDHNVGVAFELSAIAACVLGGVSLRGGEGTVIGVLIGTALMMIIQNGLEMFHIKYKTATGAIHVWKPDDNWRNVVIGAVILIAVILDQIVHVIQQSWRTRAAGKIFPPSPTGFPVVQSKEQAGKSP